MRRGQAALEFLSTYGWAFIVMMTMVGAISYFGVTNPVAFAPDHCRFTSDVKCLDFMVTTIDVPAFAPDSAVGMVLIDVRQTRGRTIYLTDFTCTDLSLGGQVFSYLQTGEDFTSTDDGFGALNDDDDNDIKPWNPEDRMTLKCFFSKNPFAGFKGELVRVPLEITVQRRESGFDHVIEGELIGKVQ